MTEHPEALLEEELEVALAIGAFLLSRNHESAAPFGRIGYATLVENTEAEEHRGEHHAA
ncbi:MAG: hypothetical protein IT290_11905 [Deltaproteobacteria bacterium]|nr:hypothetical protein [Deltaproteobacteria bacterium]